MTMMKWIGLVIIVFWILGILLRIGGIFVNWLLIIVAILFIIDLIIGRKYRN